MRGICVWGDGLRVKNDGFCWIEGDDGDNDLLLATGDHNSVVQEKHEPEAGAQSLEKQKKVREKGKKATMAKKKVEKTQKPNIPGSANRLMFCLCLYTCF